jgi:hypothetical protein
MGKNLREGRLDPAVVQGYARLDSELDDLEFATRQGSPYLRDAFYGLSLLPTRYLSRMLRAASGEEVVTAGEARGTGDDGRGAPPTYYGILESLLDLSRLKPLRQARARRPKARRKAPPFWRSADNPSQPPT